MRQIYRLFLVLLLAGAGFTIVRGAPLPAQAVTSPIHSPIVPPFTVRIHPEGPLYVGDQVSFEVFSPGGMQFSEGALKSVDVRYSGDERSAAIGHADFAKDGDTGEFRAALQWVWNTADLQPGNYRLDFVTSPQQYRWTEEVRLLPRSEMPVRLANAAWITMETPCCVIHTISGSEGERDIEALTQMANEETAAVTESFHTQLDEKIEITFIPRVKGHGGFTSNEIYVSYLDRNYAGSTTRQVLHHEIVHYVDGKLGGDYRPTMFIEGLAVYLSGGHFKPEPLLERALALPVLNEYQPLAELADHFYTNQHEAGYLEASSLIEYMVNTWGWDRFNEFYRGMKAPEDGKASSAIDAGLQEHLGISLAQLEEQFTNYLRENQPADHWVEDVRQTIAYYDTVRRYQQVLDPSAYFRSVWLPDPTDMRKRGIVADYDRRPEAAVNQVIERMLVETDKALRAGDYSLVDNLLGKINHALDIQEHLQVYEPFFKQTLQEPLG
ncbi:MAG TPA: hypothetical protein VHO48_15665 [Anaerolineaceae bacterium]|nr:hypothetical protein [Anaerolineaceae bacterium]